MDYMSHRGGGGGHNGAGLCPPPSGPDTEQVKQGQSGGALARPTDGGEGSRGRYDLQIKGTRWREADGHRCMRRERAHREVA